MLTNVSATTTYTRTNMASVLSQAFQRLVTFRDAEQHETGEVHQGNLIAGRHGMEYRHVTPLVYLDLRRTPLAIRDSQDFVDQLAHAATTLCMAGLERVRRVANLNGRRVNVIFRLLAEHRGDRRKQAWIPIGFEIPFTNASYANLFRTIRDNFSQVILRQPELRDATSDLIRGGYEWIREIHLSFLLSRSELLRGGKRGDGKQKVFPTTDGQRWIRVVDPKSSNDECGIACIVEYAKRSPYVVQSRYELSDLKRWLATRDAEPPYDVETLGALLADKYASDLIVINENGDHSYATAGHENKCTLLLKDAHYFLVEHIVGACTHCSRPNFPHHTCGGPEHNKCANCDALLVRTDGSKHTCPQSTELERIREEFRKKYQAFQEDRAERCAILFQTALGDVIPGTDAHFVFEVLFKDRQDLLVIGPAGCGKTYSCIKPLRDFCVKHDVPFIAVAPTGAAAVHIEGRTIHSMFRINPYRDLEIGTIRGEDMSLIERCEVLIFDEISMVSGPLLDAIDQFMRGVKRVYDVPFGGVSTLMTGDPNQLPPVNCPDDQRFYDSELLRQLGTDNMHCIRTHYMTECYRFKDPRWSEFLSHMRDGTLNSDDFQYIKNMEVGSGVEIPMDCIYITPLVKKANARNDKCLAQLPGQYVYYECKDEKVKTFENGRARTAPLGARGDHLAPQRVALKEGALVLCRKNIPRLDVYNGLRGTVVDCKEDYVTVLFNGRTEPTRLEYELFEDGKFKRRQIPLQLAYGLTIHKTQGLTLEGTVAMDLVECFEENQCYVALSRVPDPVNLILLSINLSGLTMLNERSLLFADPSFPKPIPLLTVNDTGDVVDASTFRPTLRYKKLRRARAEQKKKLQSKWVVYDVETWENQDAGHKLEIYSIVAKTVIGQNTVEWKHFLKENATMDPLLEFVKYLSELITHSVKEYNRLRNSKRDADKMKAQWHYKPWIISTYNGANFDFLFLIRSLFGTWLGPDYRLFFIQNGPTNTYFQISHRGQVVLVFHDLCRILNMSLSDAAKGFLGKDLKGIFPHKFMNRNKDSWQYVLPDAKKVNLTRDDFFAKDLAELDKGNIDLKALFDQPVVMHRTQEKMNIIQSVDLHVLHMKYAHDDVEILAQLYHVIDEIVIQELCVSVTNFFSITQMAKYGFVTNLPPQVKRPNGINDRKYINTELFLLDPSEYEAVAESIYGGRTLPRRQYFKSEEPLKLPSFHEVGMTTEEVEEQDRLLMLDIKAMYGSIMLNEQFPYGPPSWWDAAQFKTILDTPNIQHSLLAHKHGFFIAKVRLAGHDLDVEPSVPRRAPDGRILWDTAERVGWYTHIDIAINLQNGGRVLDVMHVLGWAPENKCKLVSKWMGICTTKKSEAEKEHSKPRKQFWKLLGNATYGMLAMRKYAGSTQFCVNDFMVANFLDENHLEGVFAYQSGMLVWGKRKEKRVEGEIDATSRNNYSASPTQIGAFILAYSRLMIDKFVHAANPMRRELMRFRYVESVPNNILKRALTEQVWYGDTDSLIIHASAFSRILEFLGKEPGQWTDDFNDDFIDEEKHRKGRWRMSLISEYASLAPKAYRVKGREFKRVDPVESYFVYPIEKSKFKGLPKHCELSKDGEPIEEISIEMMHDLLMNDHRKVEDCPVASVDRLKRISCASSKMTGDEPLMIRGQRIDIALGQTVWDGRKIVARLKNGDRILVPLNFPLDEQHPIARELFAGQLLNRPLTDCEEIFGKTEEEMESLLSP